MQDVTNEFAAFTAKALIIRNGLCRFDPEDFTNEAFDKLELFQELGRTLFKWEILRPRNAALPAEDLFTHALDWLLIRPLVNKDVLVLEQPSAPGVHRWKRGGSETMLCAETRIGFVEFFDWEEGGEVEFEFLRGNILAADGSSLQNEAILVKRNSALIELTV